MDGMDIPHTFNAGPTEFTQYNKSVIPELYIWLIVFPRSYNKGQHLMNRVDFTHYKIVGPTSLGALKQVLWRFRFHDR